MELLKVKKTIPRRNAVNSIQRTFFANGTQRARRLKCHLL